MADLLNTSDVPLAPNASTTQTVLPDWYTNYAMGILSNQQAVAANPYPAYTAQRVADFTPTQVAGQEATTAAAGSFQPGLTAATQTVNGVANGPLPSSAAAPYLSAASQSAPSVVGGYLNPYITNVTDRIAQLGNRNLTEKLLPGIGDEFVHAGNFGGSRQAEAIGRAVRDTQSDITSQQGTALASGYTGALGAAQTDLSRQGGLAQTAGNLGVADVNAGVATGAAQADLAGRTQALGLTGAGALQQVGAAQQDLGQKNLDVAYADFLRQQGYDQTQIDAMSKTLGAVLPAVPKAVLTQGYSAAPGSGDPAPTGLQTAASIANAINTLLK